MRAPTALLLACASILAGGCSEGADDRPVRSVSVRAGEPIRISAQEYRFDPGRIVVSGAGTDAALRIRMRNRGDLAHNLQLRRGEDDLAAIPSFPGDQERSLSASLPAGRYAFVCTVADHEDLGMVGELEVR